MPATTPTAGSRRRTPSVVWYLVIAFTWAWAWWLPAAFLLSEDSPFGLFHAAGGLGPAIAVVLLIRRQAQPARRAFARRVFDLHRITPRWWLAIAAVGAGPKLVAQGIAAGTGDAGFLESGTVGLGITGVVAFALAAGFAEEPGWRGVALDSLQPRWSWSVAAMIIGVAWAIWHLPLYFIDGTFHHDLGFASSGFWTTSLSLVPLSVLLAWIVNSTQGSICAAALTHALGNITGEALADDTLARAVEFAVIILAAAIVVTLRLMSKHATVASESTE